MKKRVLVRTWPKTFCLSARWVCATQGRRPIFVYDKDREIAYSNEKTKKDTFSFVTAKAGPYSLCLASLQSAATVVFFNIRTGVRAKDFSNVPLKKNIRKAEIVVESMQERVEELKNELKKIKEREIELGYTTDTIQNRVVEYSVFSIFLLGVLAVVQTAYLKRFLQSKKII
jgi:p24 family protein delta-1